MPELRLEADIFAQQQPSFAGIWFDEASQTLVYAFTDNLSVMKDEISALVDDSIKPYIEIRRAALTIDGLRDQKSRVLESMGKHGIEGVGLDPAGGGLVVVSSDRLATHSELIAKGIQVPITIRDGQNTDETCNDRLNCGGTNGALRDGGGSDRSVT